MNWLINVYNNRELYGYMATTEDWFFGIYWDYILDDEGFEHLTPILDSDIECEGQYIQSRL